MSIKQMSLYLFHQKFFIMDAFPVQKSQIAPPNNLKMAFLVSQFQNTASRSQINREGKEKVGEISEGGSAAFKKIDELLLNYSHHYAKDIESNFPDVELGRLQICPKIISHQWQIKTKADWKQCQQSNENDERYWLPIFLSQGKPNKYFEEPLQIIAVILQINNLYQGFLGYLPESLQILQVVKALCDFYDVKLDNDTMFFSHSKGLYMDITDMQKVKVKQMAGNYIKICPPSHYQRSLPNIQQIKYDQEQSYNFMNNSGERQGNYNQQSLATNHGVTDLLWMSDMDIETCEPQKQVRLKLITVKNEQQLYKLKLRTKLIIDNPHIEVPNDPEEMINASLNAIVQELQSQNELKN